MDAVTQFFSAEKLQDGNIKKAYIKSFPRILMVTLKLDPSANAIKMSIPTEISLNSFGLLHDDTGFS
ncbi:hypothetical protein MHBO_005107 [Bonamia ostreae]|uniref:Uncharacterized protein n=1 Tax=Bonamia ostreae TaxID=126728 RepID=A0ABV2AV27_9EUKA